MQKAQRSVDLEQRPDGSIDTRRVIMRLQKYRRMNFDPVGKTRLYGHENRQRFNSSQAELLTKIQIDQKNERREANLVQKVVEADERRIKQGYCLYIKGVTNLDKRIQSSLDENKQHD